MNMNGIRLQLLLAKAGIASRRHAEVLISQGHVAINGKVVTQLGTRVDPATDRISVDGKLVEQEPLAYYLLNKPKGYVTTASDPDGRQTVFDLIPDAPVRLFAVGRLDYNTEGVLLLTNDGELAHALMHPSRGVDKVYHATSSYDLDITTQAATSEHAAKLAAMPHVTVGDLTVGYEQLSGLSVTGTSSKRHFRATWRRGDRDVIVGYQTESQLDLAAFAALLQQLVPIVERAL